jgi:hypothetical protein
MKNCKLIFRGLFLIVLISVFAIFGCKKEKNSDIINDNTNKTTEYDYQSANDNSEAEITSNDVLNIADGVINNYTEKKSGKNPIRFKLYCADVTIELIKDYYKFTIDFGNTPTICYNGKVRQGKIIISIKGRYYYEGFTDTIKFDGYYVNGKHIEGTHIVSNIGNLTWTISAIGMKITGPGGKYHTWQSERQRQLLINNIKDTINPLSNFVYSITGQASGMNSKGVSYTADITKALKKHFDCWWIESGTIVLTISKKPTITLDYGNDGDCNNLATVTINGITKEINLP